MRYNLVAISREFGSGGRTVGKLAAQRLNIPCYDQELIEKIARESGFTPEFVEEKSEQASHASWLANAFADRSVQGISTQDYLWKIQFQVILELAEKGPCVLVGRCVDYILRDRADCLRVFVHADREKSGPGGSWRFTGRPAKPRKNGCGTRTSGAPRITNSTPTAAGAMPATSTWHWTAANWGLRPARSR